MSQRGKALLQELLSLPEKERQSIAEGLLKSVSATELDTALEKELDRRWKEVVSDKVKGMPHSALRLRK